MELDKKSLLRKRNHKQANPAVVVDRVDHIEDSSTNDTDTRKACINNVPLLQCNMSYLNIESLEGAPSMKQRKISDFISDMV